MSVILSLFYTLYTCIKCVKQTEDGGQVCSRLLPKIPFAISEKGGVWAPGQSSAPSSDSVTETENRLESVESALRPVFKVENLQPGTQFRAVVFAKVDKYRTYRKQGSCHLASLSQANQST